MNYLYASIRSMISVKVSIIKQEQKCLEQEQSYENATIQQINVDTWLTSIEVTFAIELVNICDILCRGVCPLTVKLLLGVCYSVIAWLDA